MMRGVSPFRRTLAEYRDAIGRFSPPARRLLLAQFLLFSGYGISQVLFNLYLIESGFGTQSVGQAIALFGLGVAATALPAGWIARRMGGGRTLMLGIAIDGVGQLLRCLWPVPWLVYSMCVVTGAGQSLILIPSSPFLAAHSTARERTHLFSTLFALSLMAGVLGSLVGGWLPKLLLMLPGGFPGGLHGAYRAALVLGALVSLSGALAFLGMEREPRAVRHAPRPTITPELRRKLVPIGVNALLIGMGAGLVIPFMNLYFAQRFACSSAQIGSFFSVAQVLTAAAALLAPVIARRFGKLRTALIAQLMSLPFLVTMGAEHRLDLAVGAFWMRATLMQAITPLISTFVMETLPADLRSTATGLMSLLWNIGWALSATLAGAVIQRFGYAVPFYATATLYAAAAVYFYASFRGSQDPHVEPDPPAGLPSLAEEQ